MGDSSANNTLQTNCDQSSKFAMTKADSTLQLVLENAELTAGLGLRNQWSRLELYVLFLNHELIFSSLRSYPRLKDPGVFLRLLNEVFFYSSWIDLKC